MSQYAIGDTYRWEFSTYNSSGVLTDADATPAGTLVVNGTDDAAAVTVTNAATGRYKVSVGLSGLGIGDDFYLRLVAAVGGATEELCTPPAKIAPSVDRGTVSASPTPTATTFTATGSLNSPSGGYTSAPMYAYFTSGVNKGSKVKITGHTVSGSNHAFTVATLDGGAPSADDTFIVI